VSRVLLRVQRVALVTSVLKNLDVRFLILFGIFRTFFQNSCFFFYQGAFPLQFGCCEPVYSNRPRWDWLGNVYNLLLRGRFKSDGKDDALAFLACDVYDLRGSVDLPRPTLVLASRARYDGRQS